MVNTAFIHCFLSRNYDVHPPQFLGNNHESFLLSV